MRYLSVCSGIEAATAAWHELGWQPWAFSEIEKFPSRVLAHHYPDVPNLGDMTKFQDWPDGAIDLLVGGTPCQSFSVAGLRAGMADPRGNLALTYLAITDRYRPRWLLWENVPGVLSSNGGRDFGAILGAMVQLGYGFAYRVLDAQFAGVPQRRRRVFVVGYLGDWRPAAEVLFELHSLQGHPAPSGKKGQRIADSLTVGANQYSGFCGEPTIARCVTTREGQRHDPSLETYVTHSLRGEGYDASEDGTGRGTPLVPAFDCKASGQNGFGVGNIASTLRSMGHANSHSNGGGHQAVSFGSTVRRLTPRECERLQGFPDDYTAIPNASDGPRYKALGNSMAVPCMRWIGERIVRCERFMAEIGMEHAA